MTNVYCVKNILENWDENLYLLILLLARVELHVNSTNYRWHCLIITN